MDSLLSLLLSSTFLAEEEDCPLQNHVDGFQLGYLHCLLICNLVYCIGGFRT